MSEDLPAFFESLVAAFSEPVGVEPTLAEIADQAKRLVPADRVAALVADTITSTPAPLAATTDPDVTDVVARVAGRAGEGPGWWAFEHGELCHVDDLTTDARFPGYSRALVELTPVRSVLSVPLVRRRSSVMGVMTLYEDRPHGFGPTEVARAEILASFAAIALARATTNDLADHLRTALGSSRTIGAAVGILVERLRLSEADAFEVLRTASQECNVKIVELSRRLVETGELPCVERALSRVRGTV